MPESFGEQLNNGGDLESKDAKVVEDLVDESFKELQNPEAEQSREKVLEILEQALKEGNEVDLFIDSVWAPKLLIDSIDTDEGFLMVTYLDENGESCEGIPLEINRVEKGKLR